MVQKLFSESLQEFNGKIDNNLLSESILGLKELIGSRNLRILQWDCDSIALSVKIKVELPPLGNFEGIDIRDREFILIKVDLKDYPTIPPLAFPDRLDFPKDSLAHLYVARKGNPPGICLVRGELAEWYSNKQLKDLYTRAENWFRDAVTGQLTEDGEQFDPVRLEHVVGTMIYDYDTVAEVVNQKKRYFENANFCIALFERTDTEKSIAFKLTRLVTSENFELSVQDVRTEKEKDDSVATKKNYHLGYIIWSDSGLSYNKYSVSFPEDWNGFKDFCEQYGISLVYLEKEIAENDMNVFVSIPVIVGIKRPKSIIGFSSDIEFVNFTVRVNTPDVEGISIINNVPVSVFKHGQPLTREKARQISGSQVNFGDYALIAGCGALGSKVVMHFARSGAANYFLADPDSLLPHNLVRHALLGNSQGMSKAEALKKEIIALFPNDKMPLLTSAKAPAYGLFAPGVSKFFSWILDFTASNAFTQTLITANFEEKTRIAKANITDFGNLALTCFEGKGRNPRLDDLLVMFYAEYKRLPFISSWLKREFENSNQPNNLSVTVGVGCNSETTVLGDDIVSLHSAFVAGVIRTESNHEQAEEGRVYFNEVRHDPFFGTSSRVLCIPRMEVLMAVNDSSWQIRMKPGIIDEIKREMGFAMPTETGGVFVGRVNYKTKTIHVTNLIKAPADSTANEICFFRGIQGLPEAIKEINDLTGNQLGYIGEWHTHPFGPDRMSSVDAATIRKFKYEFRQMATPIPVFMLIATPTHILPYVY